MKIWLRQRNNNNNNNCYYGVCRYDKSCATARNVLRAGSYVLKGRQHAQRRDERTRPWTWYIIAVKRATRFFYFFFFFQIQRRMPKLHARRVSINATIIIYNINGLVTQLNLRPVTLIFFFFSFFNDHA